MLERVQEAFVPYPDTDAGLPELAPPDSVPFTTDCVPSTKTRELFWLVQCPFSVTLLQRTYPVNPGTSPSITTFTRRFVQEEFAVSDAPD